MWVKKQMMWLACIPLLLVTGCFLVADNNPNEQEYYYWYNGEKIALYPNEDKTFLLFDHQPEPEDIASLLDIESHKIGAIKKVELGASLISTNMRDSEKENFWTVVEAKDFDFLSPVISYHAPFFYSERGGELGLTNLFYVKLLKGEDVKILEKVAKDNGVRILGNNEFMPLWYTLSCDRNSKGNALEMANLFYESRLFEASEPDLMEEMLP